MTRADAAKLAAEKAEQSSRSTTKGRFSRSNGQIRCNDGLKATYVGRKHANMNLDINNRGRKGPGHVEADFAVEEPSCKEEMKDAPFGCGL